MRLLSDPGRVEVDPGEVVVTDADGRAVEVSQETRAGAIWVRATALEGGELTLHLVDLRSQVDAFWDAPKARNERARSLQLRWDRRLSRRCLAVQRTWPQRSSAVPAVASDGSADLRAPAVPSMAPGLRS